MIKENDEQFDIRKQKLAVLKEKGISSYPASFENRLTAADALLKNEGAPVRVAGRMMSRRLMGKAAFINIKDSTASIQVYMKYDKLGKAKFELFKDMDIGDFIGVEGELFITRTGEKTINASKYEFLSKSLRALPEKWHGLKDIQIRYRKRYLDLIMNNEVSKVLKTRASIINSIREILSNKEFIEVETPILQELAGGAQASPFTTHHNTLDLELYLRIAPELYLKRLLVGGWDKVFEIGRNFRNEGISTRHNPEFTMLEVYSAYTDYRYMMKLSKEIITGVWRKNNNFEIDIDFENGWSEENLWDLLSRYTNIKFSPSDDYNTLKIKSEKLEVPPGKDSSDKIVDRIFSAYVQKHLIQPTFVTGYLSEHSPLAKKSPNDNKIAERFEIFINGYEVGNAYSEQNDPQVQREMFEKQVGSSEECENQNKIDEDYIEALEYGMPPASGLGIGIDRLIMLITGMDSIREVILFPLLRKV